jgi:cytochrome P450
MGSDAPPGPSWPSPAQTFAFYRWPFAFLERNRDRYGKRFTVRPTDNPPLVFLSDPAEIRALFAASAEVLHPGEGGSAIEPIVGEGSFMLMDEDEHLQGRRAVAPSFHREMTQRHGDLVADLAEREVASWPRDTPVALHPRFRALTLEVVLRTIFGDQDDDRIDALRDRILSALAVTSSPTLVQPWLRKLPPGRGIWRRFLRRQREVDEILVSLIEERMQDGASGDDVLGVLLATQEKRDSPAPIRRLRDDLMSVILAGHETTASELAWACQLLAHNPAALDPLASEVDEGCGDAYLTATIQEVMRHRPVFLFAIPRAVKRPVEVGGWTYRPPVHLLASIYLVHHDPETYPDPHSFRPERFLERPPDPQTWLPWGGGRKFCPGLHLATLEIQATLRAMLSAAFIRPAAREIERPAWRNVIVTPQAGSRVVLRDRGRRRAAASEASRIPA